MRIGIQVLPQGDVAALIREVERAEAAGFRSFWLANVATVDALTVLALAGSRTSAIELGTFVVPTYPRHPAALAQAALTVQAIVGGRLTLGIGLSHRATMEGRLGLAYDRPIRHMREYLGCLRPLLAGEVVNYAGEEFRITGYQLTVAGAAPPPVLVAALGPQMLRLAGRLADGTAIWMGGPRYLAEHAAPTITQAAREVGRPAPRIVVALPICVTDRPEPVRQAASQTFARYGELPSYRAILDREGAAGPADVALIGPEAAVAAGLDALAGAGATDFAANVFAPPGEDPARTYALLQSRAARVRP